MTLRKISARSFKDADRLADAIIQEVGKTIVLALPLGLGKANHIANALFARAIADSSIRLNIFTALTLEKPRARNEIERRFLAPLADRLFAGYPDLAYAAVVRAGTLPANIQINEFFFQAGQWLGVPHAQQNYISANYTHALRYVLDRGVNVIAQLVARRYRGDERQFSLSCNPDLTRDLLTARREARATFLLAGQINSELPFMSNDAKISAGEFDFLLDGPDTDFSLFAPPREPIGLADYAAGLHAARTVPDGGTLQIGIGSLGDAVARSLILRHRSNEDFRKLLTRIHAGETAPTMCDTAPFSIGLYGCSEMFVEGLLDLFKAGVLNREVGGAMLHAAFFIGSRSFYKALRDMPETQLAKFHMTAVSYVNELYGGEAAKRRARVKARFINDAMMATLMGDVISDGLGNGQVVSGVGGQYNFVSQAFALDDARAIIVLRSTRNANGKARSNILWNYPHTTIPRHLRDIVITEYGIADLRGKPDREVIAAMLAVTDSRYQDELLRQAKDAGKIERTVDLPNAVRENTPETIERALRPARDEGFLPPFPFGTDFTEVEQRLLPALQVLKGASPLQLATLLVQGVAPTHAHQDCLARMGLERPSTPTDWLYALLLRGALRTAASAVEWT
jgi:acyl-CoA hydrolase